MTNLEAIKGKVGYPLDDNAYIVALEERDLVYTDTYSPAVNKRAMDLAKADVLYSLASAPSVSEGGYSVSVGEKASIKAIADGIYDKYGEARPGTPSAEFRDIM